MELDDREIVAAIRDNPEKGFSLLMKKYIEPVYWHIRRLVVSHADAQDAAQETFVRAFRSFGSFRDGSLRSLMDIPDSHQRSFEIPVRQTQ